MNNQTFTITSEQLTELSKIKGVFVAHFPSEKAIIHAPNLPLEGIEVKTNKPTRRLVDRLGFRGR